EHHDRLLAVRVRKRRELLRERETAVGVERRAERSVGLRRDPPHDEVREAAPIDRLRRQEVLRVADVISAHPKAARARRHVPARAACDRVLARRPWAIVTRADARANRGGDPRKRWL